MIDRKTSPAFAWDGHCVYGDKDSIEAVHKAIAIVAAAKQAVRSLRDDGWNEYDDQALHEEWCELMRLIPESTGDRNE